MLSDSEKPHNDVVDMGSNPRSDSGWIPMSTKNPLNLFFLFWRRIYFVIILSLLPSLCVPRENKAETAAYWGQAARRSPHVLPRSSLCLNPWPEQSPATFSIPRSDSGENNLLIFPLDDCRITLSYRGIQGVWSAVARTQGAAPAIQAFLSGTTGLSAGYCWKKCLI